MDSCVAGEPHADVARASPPGITNCSVLGCRPASSESCLLSGGLGPETQCSGLRCQVLWHKPAPARRASRPLAISPDGLGRLVAARGAGSHPADCGPRRVLVPNPCGASTLCYAPCSDGSAGEADPSCSNLLRPGGLHGKPWSPPPGGAGSPVAASPCRVKEGRATPRLRGDRRGRSFPACEARRRLVMELDISVAGDSRRTCDPRGVLVDTSSLRHMCLCIARAVMLGCDTFRRHSAHAVLLLSLIHI